MNLQEINFPSTCSEYLQRFVTNSRESKAVDRLAAALRASLYTDYHRIKGISYGDWMTSSYESYYFSSASLPQLHMYGIWESGCTDTILLACSAIHSWVKLCEKTGDKFRGKNRIWNSGGSETTILPDKKGISVLLNDGASIFFNTPPDYTSLTEAMKISGNFSGMWTWKSRDERRLAEEFLRQSSPKNAYNLRRMHEAGLVVCIDERSPQTTEETWRCLCSPHSSRWFPNAIQYFIFRSGITVVCLDHLSFIGGDFDPLIQGWKEGMKDFAYFKYSCDSCPEVLEWDTININEGLSEILTNIKKTHIRHFYVELPEKISAARLTHFFTKALRQIHGDPVPIFSIGCSMEHLGEKLDFAFLVPAEVSRLINNSVDFEKMVRRELSIVKNGGGIYARLYAISCLDENVSEICMDPFLTSFLIVADYMTVVRTGTSFSINTLKPDGEKGICTSFNTDNNNGLHCTVTGFSEYEVETTHRELHDIIC
ncbi:MAG: choline/carnitine O-acyltransferase [Desulfobacterales bacterium]|nr:choline/carnitine O-acyltransferase [Desulfobacterales bacterium]